jgi:replicative DNA helicase
VVVDFIQNVIEKGDEYEKLSKVSLELQKIAKEKNCCIIVLSQLSNNAYKTNAMEYKGSGSIATVCDLGIFVVRDVETMDKMILTVKKNRRGRSNIEVVLQSIYPGGKIVEL